jgi:very-short-patch-repair endonuclease
MTKARKEGPLSPRERDRVRDSKTSLARARALRKASTDAERLLWRHLRARRLTGFKFRRQEVIGPYTVDLVCLEARLIIEADGGQHAGQLSYDRQRSVFLAARGYRVLRFWNNEILGDIEGVLERIRLELI